MITDQVVLNIIDHSKPIILSTDSSELAIGAVLEQFKDDVDFNQKESDI